MSPWAASWRPGRPGAGLLQVSAPIPSGRIFPLAIVGGLLALCTLGYFASLWGVTGVRELLLAGSIVVFGKTKRFRARPRVAASSTTAGPSFLPGVILGVRVSIVVSLRYVWVITRAI